MFHKKITSPYGEFRVVRKNIISALITGVTICTFLILFSPEKSTTFWEDFLRCASAGIAAILSLVIVYRQGLDGLLGKAYAALAIGISFWFIAEMIWTYYQVGLGIESPFPSVADLFWLIGYLPFIYYMFKTYKMYTKEVRSAQIIVVSFVAVVAVAFYIYQTFISADLSTSILAIEFLISAAYPLGDLIFVVPAILVVLNSSKGELTSIPWIFLAMLITAAADIIFGYTSVTNIAAHRVWNPIYIAGYLLFAAGLFWHNRFFVRTANHQSKTNQ